MFEVALLIGHSTSLAREACKAPHSQSGVFLPIAPVLNAVSLKKQAARQRTILRVDLWDHYLVGGSEPLRLLPSPAAALYPNPQSTQIVPCRDRI